MVLRRVSLRIKYAFSAAKLTPSTPPPCSPLQKGPEIVTTGRILLERQRAMCPRLGDAYARTERAAIVKEEVAFYRIKKAVDKGLDTVDLAGCSFPFVPDELRQVPSLAATLVDLNLARNQLFSTDAAFAVLKNLVNLKRLSLANNFLNGKLSEEAGRLVRLEELDLDGNQLTELPESCENWSELRVFSCGGNKMITALPEGVEHWTKLEMCNLRENALTSLPAGASKWKKIKRLFLGSNKFAEIPDAVGFMPELSELDARGNEVTEIPMCLAACEKLEHLNLGRNKIATIPETLISGFTNLREVREKGGHKTREREALSSSTDVE